MLTGSTPTAIRDQVRRLAAANERGWLTPIVIETGSEAGFLAMAGKKVGGKRC